MGKEDIDLISVEKSEGKKSLLERYDIPIENLCYEYIGKCTSGKELERMILILRSGEEGFYPDLVKHAEERLAVVKPTSSILRTSEPIVSKASLPPERRKTLDDELDDWMRQMKLKEKDLLEGKSLQFNRTIPQPDVREITFAEPKKKDIHKGEKQSKRISSCNYAAWDKYDVDTELNRIDLKEEKRQVEIRRAQKKHQEEQKKVKVTTREEIFHDLVLSVTEFNIMAEEERQKGNESFRAGDYHEALQYYNFSISIDPTPKAYNNRAITHIKLRKYEEAIRDCDEVLKTDERDTKALLRRALAFEHLEKNEKALHDYERVLQLESTNKIAIAGVKKLRAPSNSRKIKMKIEEVTDTEELMSTSSADKKNLNQVTKVSNGITKQLAQYSGRDSQICFCNNAPSSSQHTSPLPHIRDVYCTKGNSNGFRASKFESSVLQNIYGDASRRKTSGVIIQEIKDEINEESRGKLVKECKEEMTNNNNSHEQVVKDTREEKEKSCGVVIEEIKDESVEETRKINFIETIEKEETEEEKGKFCGVIIEEITDESVEESGSRTFPKKSEEEEMTRTESSREKIVEDTKEETGRDKSLRELIEDVTKQKWLNGVIVGEDKIEERNTISENLRCDSKEVSMNTKNTNEMNKMASEKIRNETNKRVIINSRAKRRRERRKKRKRRNEALQTQIDVVEGRLKDEENNEEDENVTEKISEMALKQIKNEVDMGKVCNDAKKEEIINAIQKEETSKKIQNEEITNKIGKEEIIHGIKEDEMCEKIQKQGTKEVIIDKSPNEETIKQMRTSCIANKNNENGVQSQNRRKMGLSIWWADDVEGDREEVTSHIEISKMKTSTSSEKVNGLNSTNELLKQKNEPEPNPVSEKKCSEISMTPYEFTKHWHSLKNDTDLLSRSKLLLSFAPEDVDTVIGNQMDGEMLSIILRCFENHFCTAERSSRLSRFLQSLTKIKRFSMICMFLNAKDKKVLRDLFHFLEAQNSEDVRNLRKIYDISI